jgi:hypothetical protein
MVVSRQGCDRCRGLQQDRSARAIVAGHAFVQNLRRGHYELAVDEPVNRRLAVAFNELAMAICSPGAVVAPARRAMAQRNTATARTV